MRRDGTLARVSSHEIRASGMGSGSRSGSMTSTSVRRLRLADLRRDEEDRELRLRGCKSVEAM